VTTTIEPAEGTPLVYQCALPLSRQTLTFVAGLLRARLKKIGSRRRKLPPGKIAHIVLATLRHDLRLADMAGGNGVSAFRCLRPAAAEVRLAVVATLSKGYDLDYIWKEIDLSPAKDAAGYYIQASETGGEPPGR
jgi:hypothetical protein